MAIAYIKLDGVQGREVVDYSIGPVLENVDDVRVGWYRNSFSPQPIGGTWPSGGIGLQIGQGQTGANNGGGSFAVTVNDATNPIIAVPDEMQTTPIAPRTLQHGKTFMVFYGALGAPLAATRSGSTLTLPNNHGLYNGQVVTVRSTTTLPAPLLPDTLYYVVSRAANSISLSLTPGGSVITLSTDGTGTHSVVPFTRVGWFDMADNPRVSNTRPLGIL